MVDVYKLIAFPIFLQTTAHNLPCPFGLLDVPGCIGNWRVISLQGCNNDPGLRLLIFPYAFHHSNFPEVNFHLADSHPLRLVTRVPNIEASSSGLHTEVAKGQGAMRGG